MTFFDLRQYFLLLIILILCSWLNKKGLKMENIYLNNPEPDDIYDGPTDDELKRIEDELEKYSNWAHC